MEETNDLSSRTTIEEIAEFLNALSALPASKIDVVRSILVASNSAEADDAKDIAHSA